MLARSAPDPPARYMLAPAAVTAAILLGQPAPDTGGRVAASIPLVRLDLDLPPLERWKTIVQPYKDQFGVVTDYLKSVIPAWSLPLVDLIAADVTTYFGDLGLEMQGAAAALDVPTGTVVVMNLMMQLEQAGLNCSSWNNTGPTIPDDPGCVAVDPKQTWCYCHAAAHTRSLPADRVLRTPPRTGPGLCTSIVAQTADGRVLHARNLDWNLPSAMRRLIFDVDFVRNGTVPPYPSPAPARAAGLPSRPHAAAPRGCRCWGAARAASASWVSSTGWCRATRRAARAASRRASTRAARAARCWTTSSRCTRPSRRRPLRSARPPLSRKDSPSPSARSPSFPHHAPRVRSPVTSRLALVALAGAAPPLPDALAAAPRRHRGLHRLRVRARGPLRAAPHRRELLHRRGQRP